MSYEVLYNDCYGGFGFPDRFVEEVFRQFPPESEEGMKLWEPTIDRFILENDILPKDKWVHRILKTEDFCHGYKWIYYECIDDKGQCESYQPHMTKVSKYCTKDFKTYYYVTENGYKYIWRSLPAIVAMAKEYNLIHSKQRHTDLRIAKVPNGYTFRISECDGMETVNVICPTEVIIEDLLRIIHTGNRESLNPLTQSLLDSHPIKEVLNKYTEYDEED